MTAEKEVRTSVLASLTAEVMADKKATASGGRKLTPVEGEAAPPPAALPRTPAMFPNDMPQEVVEQKANELTRIIGHLTEARDSLLLLVKRPLPDTVVDLDAERKAREEAADARAAEPDFNAAFKAQQAEAQAAVFEAGSAEETGSDDSPAEPVATGGWTCPDHGKAVEKTSTKTGKTFIGCPDCNQFKR